MYVFRLRFWNALSSQAEKCFFFSPQILPPLASLKSFTEHENKVQFETPRFSLLFLKFFQKNKGGEGSRGDRVQAWGGYGATFINHIKN